MGNTSQSMQSSCKLTDQISLFCKQVTPIPHCTLRETTTNQTISLPGLVAEMGNPKPTCWISGLFPCRLQRQSLDRARDGLGVSVPGALVEVFIECKVVHSWFGSLVCPVPGCSREVPAPPRDARGGTAISAVAANRSAHTKAPRKPKATWEAKVQVGKGSTVPEVNISAVEAALPEVQPSAAGAGACEGTQEGQSVPQPPEPHRAPPQPPQHCSHTSTHSERATLRLCLQQLENLLDLL